MPCEFVTQLSKLRKQSMESVENTSSFDDFKKYLHVIRPVETELRNLLARVNHAGKKHLILLCGSAGDGKSHLLSFLRNADSEQLLKDYYVYNDATESSAPTLTSIDTLAEKLSPFNDYNYMDDDGYKMILAINLGTLINFIESEEGKYFSCLKKYVEANEILSGYSHVSVYQPDSVFQHVSFSDFQIFSLRENGIGTDYLEELLERVFSQNDSNPFYNAYAHNSGCSVCQRCPVRHNFEFLLNPNHRKSIIKKIVEVVIKDKAIVSTRDVLNFLYDILVHPDFSYTGLCSISADSVKYLSTYIQHTTPMLIYELKDVSPLSNEIRKHDILKERTENLDVATTRFHALENIKESFDGATSGTPYSALASLTSISVLGGIKPELKKLVYRFIVRTSELKGELPESNAQNLFAQYIQFLYYQNSGKERKLQKLYDATKRAVLNWDGQFESDQICIDDSNDKYWIVEQLLLSPSLYSRQIEDTADVQRFSTSIKVRFKKASSPELNTAELSIDYALFELILAMREGYRPTVQDKNHHADFVSFVQRLIEFGNKNDRIILVPKGSDSNHKAVFEKTDFGYEFKVV